MLVKLIYVKNLLILISISSIDGFFRQKWFHDDKWFHDLANYIQHDLKVYQIIIITDRNGKNQDLLTNDIIIRIKSSLPTKDVSHKNVTLTKALHLVKAGIKTLRTTTLLIAIQTLEFDYFHTQVSDLMKILSHLSGKNTKPKTLLIVLSSEKLPSYGRLLQAMWSADLLDFTILEVLQLKINSNQHFLGHSQNIISVHQYNPFTKVYTKRNYSSKVVIFPTKLRDLNGFKMKVNSFDLSPTLTLTRNSSGYPIALSGPDVLIAKTLSKVMNFKILVIASDDDEGWGHYDPIGNKSTGATKNLANKKVQFSANLGDYVSGGEAIAEFIRVDNHFCYVPVVPITKTKTLIRFSWHYFYLGLLISFLIVLPVFVSYIFKFDKYSWVPLYVFQATLGFAIPREPSRLAERIVFIIILFAYFISSSAIYAVLTDLTLTMEVEEEIKTLKDLRNTNLTLMTDTSIADIIRKTANDPIFQSILYRMKTVSDSQECINFLIKHKNVTCIMRDLRAQIYINKVNKKNTLIKAAKPCLRSGVTCVVLQKGSPYLARFDEILERLRHSGLIRKWYDYKFLNTRRDHQVEELGQQTNILIPLLVVLVSGYVISLVAFAFELFLNSFVKNNV